ncbi:hypothetical protein C5S35_16935 [Candidatus Methanophagaceae archaeon]|nr:hypothetical protein C5S35_16935 [Methanophagales archaeon]
MKKKQRSIVSLAGVTIACLLTVLVACIAPASAKDGPVDIDQLNRYEEVVPNGSYWLDWDKSGATTVNFNVPDIDLYKVRIYNSAWMPSNHITATYPNGSSPLPDRYPHIDDYTRYTGCGTTGVWYPNDTVKDVTIPGATNTYSTSDSGHGTALTILYQDDSNPNPLYSWFYQGYDDVDCGQGWVYYTFNNVPASSATNWTLMLAVTCADNGIMRFNGNDLSGSGFSGSTKWYHVATHDVSGVVQNGNNIVGFNAVDDDYTHPYWMWLVGTTPSGGSNTTPPVSVTNLQNITYEQTYINWTWTDPADVDFSHVIVYRNNVPKPNVTKGVQYYNATGLSPNNSYVIATHTVDTTGNINQTWVNHTAWTAPSSGTTLCGDVNEDGNVDWDDVETLWYDYAGHQYPGAYTITNEWAADVNCDGVINMDDVMTLWYDVKDYPNAGDYEVNCSG